MPRILNIKKASLVPKVSLSKSNFTSSPIYTALFLQMSSNQASPSTKKDYESAFARLQTQFGAIGHAPCQPPPPQSTMKKAPPQAGKSSYSRINHISSGKKDYASAFGYLQSQFGASGQTPYHPSIGNSSKSKSKK